MLEGKKKSASWYFWLGKHGNNRLELNTETVSWTHRNSSAAQCWTHSIQHVSKESIHGTQHLFKALERHCKIFLLPTPNRPRYLVLDGKLCPLTVFCFFFFNNGGAEVPVSDIWFLDQLRVKLPPLPNEDNGWSDSSRWGWKNSLPEASKRFHPTP